MRPFWSNCRIYSKNRRNRHGGCTLYRPSLHVKYIDHYLWIAPTGYIYHFCPITYDSRLPDWLNKWIPPLPIFKGHLKICGKVEFK